MKHVKTVLKALLWIAIILGLFIAIGRFTFWVPGEAPDNTMAPLIWKGDKFLVMTRGKIDRGSIVYCDHPVFAGQVIVGRVVGKPGDTIEIYRGQFRLNDDTLFEEWEDETITHIDRESSTNLTKTTFKRSVMYVSGHRAELMYPEKGHDVDMKKTKVKNGFFLMGDNRTLVLGAADSRTYGEVHESLCKGRVLFIWKAAKGIGDPDLKIRIFKLLL